MIESLSNPETLVSLISLAIAIISLILVIRSNRDSKRTALTMSNYQMVFDAERDLDEDLFELHNIDKTFFSENDISPDQLRYMVRSFHAAAVFYTADKKHSVLSEYRKNLLANPKVKLMYQKVIREKFLDLSKTFIAQIDSYYKKH